VGFFRDITERKRAEKERQQLGAQLVQAQKLESIGTLAGGVAHEINNPIMGIMNYAQLILDRLGPESPVVEFATEIGKETERVAKIVKNLLAFARHEKQAHSPARMCDIVESTLSLIRAVMRHDQVTLEVDVPADLPQIKCRSQQIQQVIMNLLTNARDALNQRYPGNDANKKVAITARLIEKDDRPWIRTTVEDHGPGVPEDLRERIFEPFFTTKPRDKGTGLGLSISHGIVKDHGGELSVESAVGEFTRFQLDLPVDNGWELGNGEGGTPNGEPGIKKDELGATS
jgi:signal transduction histidine kinase